MKKKRFMFILAIVAMFMGLLEADLIATAKEEEISKTYFTEKNSLFGYTDLQTRGVYLVSGDAAISKISSYKVGVSGETTAAVRCKVSVTVILERYNMETDKWLFINSWTQTNENAFTAGVSKSVIVDSGYYYRVRCSHYAATDASSSCTNALYVGN